jgi:hypothetical protein
MSDTVLTAALIQVVHPLDDLPEQKLYRPELGRMLMTRQVRLSLLLLQAYLAAMVLLVGWRVFTTL